MYMHHNTRLGAAQHESGIIRRNMGGGGRRWGHGELHWRVEDNYSLARFARQLCIEFVARCWLPVHLSASRAV